MKFKRLKENKQLETSVDVVVNEKDKTIEQSIEDERETNKKVLKDVMKETTPKDLPLKGPKSPNKAVTENYSVKLEGFNYKQDKDNFTVNCKTRAELAKLIESLKQNNIKHRISKSITEGYRYDVCFKNKLLKEEVEKHDIEVKDNKIIIDGNEYELLDQNETYYLFRDENDVQEIRKDGTFDTDESLKESSNCTYKYEVHAVDDKDEDKVYKEFKDEQKAVEYAKKSGIKCFIDKVTYCDDEYSDSDTIYGPTDLEESNLANSTLKKGDKVRLDKEHNSNIKDKSLLDDEYEVIGFWNNEKVVDDDKAPENIRDLSGVRIKNIRTGKQYSVNRYQLTSIDEALKESYHYHNLEIDRDGEEDNEYVIIEGTREGYSISQVEGDTMTVGELIDYLRDTFDDETKILIGNDWQRGGFYTYGSINSGSIYHTDIIDVNNDEDEDDEDLEEESLKENKKNQNIEYFDEDLNEKKDKKQPKAHWNDNPEKSAENIANGTNYNQEAETCTEGFKDEMAEIKKDRPNFCQCFEFENGEVLYVNYDEETNELYAGHLDNDGVSKEYVIDYDSDFELQPNLEELYSTIIEKHPEFLDSEVTEDFSDDINIEIEEVPTEEQEVNVEDDDFDLDFDDSVYIDDEESEDEIPSDFDGQMDYLANDEEEAIDGYKQVIDKVEDEHVVDELKKIETEEKAHKDFLNKVKTDKEATYEEPLPQEDEEEVVVDVVDEEGKTVDFKESLSGLKKIKFVDSNNQSNVNNNLEESLNEEIVVDENVDDEPFSL